MTETRPFPVQLPLPREWEEPGHLPNPFSICILDPILLSGEGELQPTPMERCPLISMEGRYESDLQLSKINPPGDNWT